MSQQVKLETQARTDFGKGYARRIRANHWVPAVVYGTDHAPQHVSVPGHDLMMALKQASVILEINVDGQSLNVAPRQVQRDPVKQVIEHVDLVILTQAEVRERLVVGAAVAKAEERAIAEELDPANVVLAVREFLDEGQEPDEAIESGIAKVKELLEAQATAAAAAAAAEDAAAVAGEAEGEADAGGAAASDEG